MIHSDQGSQFTGKGWQSFPSKHNLDASMSRRGNCHDNAVSESFFHLQKRERIRRRTHKTRAAARQDVFDYFEMFQNPTRKHTNNSTLLPFDYEMKQQKMNEAGVWETQGTSLLGSKTTTQRVYKSRGTSVACFAHKACFKPSPDDIRHHKSLLVDPNHRFGRLKQKSDQMRIPIVQRPWLEQ